LDLANAVNVRWIAAPFKVAFELLLAVVPALRVGSRPVEKPAGARKC